MIFSVGFKPTCYFFHFSAVTQNQHKITDMYKSGHLNIISLEHLKSTLSKKQGLFSNASSKCSCSRFNAVGYRVSIKNFAKSVENSSMTVNAATG